MIVVNGKSDIALIKALITLGGSIMFNMIKKWVKRPKILYGRTFRFELINEKELKRSHYTLWAYMKNLTIGDTFTRYRSKYKVLGTDNRGYKICQHLSLNIILAFYPFEKGFNINKGIL